MAFSLLRVPCSRTYQIILRAAIQRRCISLTENAFKDERLSRRNLRLMKIETKMHPKALKFVRKHLQKRVLTAEEVEQDNRLQDGLSDMDPEDVFGTLTEDTPKTSHKETSTQEQTKQKSNTAFHNKIKTEQECSQSDYKNEKVETLGRHADSDRRSPEATLSRHADSDRRSPEATAGSSMKYRHNSYSKNPKYRPKYNKQDPANVFGTLADERDEGESIKFEQSEIGANNERFPDVEEETKHRRLSSYDRVHLPYWYGRKIARLGKTGRVKEAIALVEEQMLKRDRVMPDCFVFTQLIAVLGRVGYTSMAFKMFNKMKKMGIEPVGHTYTALFNACSNSPWPEDGLSRAKNLYSLMREQDMEPNLVTYKAMIKAYGMCGDIRGAFALVDEVASKHKLDQHVFSFLMMACISDKKAGFIHMLKVWRVMRQRNIFPDLPLYNLLLRCVRDCCPGDIDTLNRFIKEKDRHCLISGERSAEQILIGHETRQASQACMSITSSPSDEALEGKQMQEGRFHDAQETYETAVNKPNDISNSTSVSYDAEGLVHLPARIPNIELNNFHKSSADMYEIIHVNSAAKPGDRLALLGGMLSILRRMKAGDVQPDKRTFSLLMEIIPSDLETETELLTITEIQKVKLDVTFFNIIIRKRSLREDLQAARDVLPMITALRLKPDIKTFGCLAMGCSSHEDGMQLLSEMETAGMPLNIEILNILIYQSRNDFHYKLKLLHLAESRGLQPQVKTIQLLEDKVAQTKKLIVQMERGENVPGYLHKENFHRWFKNFMKFYSSWLKRTPLESTQHPWAPFKEDAVEQ